MPRAYARPGSKQLQRNVIPDDVDLSSPVRSASLDDAPPKAPEYEVERPQRSNAGTRSIVHEMDHDDERLNRLRRERARRLALERDNEFLADGPSGIPQLPDDDPEWAYAWKRHSLPSVTGTENRQSDVQNLVDATHGMMRYDFVTMAMLPEKWQAKLKGYAVLEGKHAGFLVHKDLIAARQPRDVRARRLRADAIRAEDLRDSVRADAEANAEEIGLRLRVDNIEKRMDSEEAERRL